MPGFEAAFQSIGSMIQNAFASILNRMILAAIILLIGFVAGKLFGNLVRHLLREVGIDNAVRTAGIKISIEKLLGSVVEYGLYFISLIMALGMLGLDTFVLNLIAGAVIIVVVFSTLLAIKDFLPNIFAGFFIHYRNMIREGDSIEFDGMDAKVVKTDMIEVKLQTKKGDTIFIPNSVFLKRKLVKKRR
ncbi:MAG: mechanosensitive ion channel domain-containing protein [Candidatus Woesearchaeota archaeon]